MLLSICVPTYNRAKHLNNFLAAWEYTAAAGLDGVELCISDNASTDHTATLVAGFRKRFPVVYHRNDENVGVANNVIKVVSMAKGRFAWLLGDDDLLLPGSVEIVLALLRKHESTDFFYVNAYHLSTDHVFSFPQPFSMANLPPAMEKFSNWEKEGELPFLDLVNPKISFDFLGGMFLAVFRTEKWRENVAKVDPKALTSKNIFSHFDNTFVHVKIFANAFARSKAYFLPNPVTVCLSGAREWAPMYPLVRSVRLIEALIEYRKNGLPFSTYLRCRNFALAYFVPDMIFMWLHRRISGFSYINPFIWTLRQLMFPNTYLSFFYYIFRKIMQLTGRGK